MTHPKKRPFRSTAVLTAGFLVLAFLAGPLQAGDGKVLAQNVISEITADWNGDGAFDRALLLISEEDDMDVDLRIYLSTDNAMTLAVDKPRIVWRGGMAGTEPDLSVNERGSLVVTSRNDSIGRHRWTRKLTLAYRDGAFVVAGYTLKERDTLEQYSPHHCDLNLLSGRGVRNGKSLELPPALSAPRLADWSEEEAAKVCPSE